MCSFIQRSSTSTAAAAFAIATSASSNPRELSPLHDQRCCSVERKRKESVMSTAATMRVLNVLKHWISKHPQVPFDKFKHFEYLLTNKMNNIFRILKMKHVLRT